MSAGIFLLVSGVIFLAAAATDTVLIKIFKKSDRERLEERMKERY